MCMAGGVEFHSLSHLQEPEVRWMRHPMALFQLEGAWLGHTWGRIHMRDKL